MQCQIRCVLILHRKQKHVMLNHVNDIMLLFERLAENVISRGVCRYTKYVLFLKTCKNDASKKSISIVSIEIFHVFQPERHIQVSTIYKAAA